MELVERATQPKQISTLVAVSLILLLSILAGLTAYVLRLRLGSGVGQDHASKIPRRVPEHRERDVTAHRQAADDRLVDVERIEQVDDVGSKFVNRGGDVVSGRSVEPAELGRDDAPAMRG